MFRVGPRGFECAVFCVLAVRMLAGEVTLRGRVVDEALFAARASIAPVGRESVKARRVEPADFTAKPIIHAVFRLLQASRHALM